MNEISLLVVVISLVVPTLGWIAAFILFRAYRNSNSLVLKERTIVAILLSVAITIDSILSFNNLAGSPASDSFEVLLYHISIILISVPNIYWLSLYVRNKLHR